MVVIIFLFCVVVWCSESQTDDNGDGEEKIRVQWCIRWRSGGDSSDINSRRGNIALLIVSMVGEGGRLC